MSAIEVIKREKKKNKKLQEELEQMITELKVQIEEDKRIEEALKEQLEGKDWIIGNLEADIVTLRKDKYINFNLIKNISAVYHQYIISTS